MTLFCLICGDRTFQEELNPSSELQVNAYSKFYRNFVQPSSSLAKPLFRPIEPLQVMLHSYKLMV